MIDYGYCQSEACWGDPYMNGDAVRKAMQGIRDVGGSRVRIGVQVGTWANLDRAVDTAVEFGLKPLICILGNTKLVANSMTNPSAFGALCKAVALRYGPSGSNKVAEYELMNESNSSLNPPKVTTAAAFVDFLKTGYAGIKSVHTSSTVIAGGTIPAPHVATTPIVIPFPPFLIFGSCRDPLEWYQGIYAANGGNSNGLFDALGMHMYTDEPPTPETRQWKYMTDVRDVMVANGDTTKKMWITEVGATFPSNTKSVTSLIVARDRAKAMIDGILSYPWMGPFFVYNFRCSENKPNDPNGSNYGIVDFNFNPRSPYYEYAQTIAGTPADSDDIVAPTPPTDFVVTDATARSAVASWGPATDDVGVTVYRIYDNATHAKMGETAQIGQTFTTVGNLTPGTPYELYATAVDAAGNESEPSNTFPFTTDTPSGHEENFFYDFTDSPPVPMVFGQLGVGFNATGGVALPNVPTTNGEYFTVAPYGTDHASPEHYSEITQSSLAVAADRGAMACVQMSPDGLQGVAAVITGGGKADACQIISWYNGVPTVREAIDADPLRLGEKLRITPAGNVYTAQLVVDGVVTDLLDWVDVDGKYLGNANLRSGIGWFHRRVGGIHYSAPGIATWKAADLTPVTPSVGVQMWQLAIAKPSRLGLVLSTGLWEAAL